MKTQIVVIGGKGKEGQRWVKILKPFGDITVIDKSDPIISVANADLVVAALPWRVVKEAKGVFDLIRKGALCISVMGLMGRNHFFKADDGKDLFDKLTERGIEVMFIHCMCASHMSLNGQNVMVDDSTCLEENRQWISDLLSNLGAKMIPVHREHHDKIVKFTQKFMREIAMMFAVSAEHEGVSLGEMISFSTPPSRAFLAMVCRVLLQPRALNEQIVLDMDIPRGCADIFTSLHLGDGLKGDHGSKKFQEFLEQASTFVQNDLAKELASSLG